jgi:hypothetical protein
VCGCHPSGAQSPSEHMRVSAVICSVTLALVAATGFADAATRRAQMGNLAGTTKIAAACPVPSRLCKSWQPYPHAQFTVTRLNAAGKRLARTTRTVRSDADARFHISLRAGRYVVMPARGVIAKSGGHQRVRVQAGGTRTITVRFAGHFHLR